MRVVQIAQQLFAHLPQTLSVPMHLGTAPQSHIQQKAGLTWERVGLDRFALDQTRIAHGRFLARRTPIHQHHFEPALLQMQCGANTDHARAQNKNR